MNRLVKAIVFSVSTALVATSAFAAPQHQPAPHQGSKHQANFGHNQAGHKGPQHQKPNFQYDRGPQQGARYDGHKPNQQYRSEKPSRDWRVGQKLPSKFKTKSYHVNYKHSHKLSKPGKNQQWVHVNGDYILMNLVTHAIIKIIAG